MSRLIRVEIDSSPIEINREALERGQRVAMTLRSLQAYMSGVEELGLISLGSSFNLLENSLIVIPSSRIEADLVKIEDTIPIAAKISSDKTIFGAPYLVEKQFIRSPIRVSKLDLVQPRELSSVDVKVESTHFMKDIEGRSLAAYYQFGFNLDDHKLAVE